MERRWKYLTGWALFDLRRVRSGQGNPPSRSIFPAHYLALASIPGVCMRFLSFVVLALAAARIAEAAPAQSASHRFEGNDLFALQRVTDPQIRPDGGAVAYVRESFDIMIDRSRHAIWLVDTHTAAQEPLDTGPLSASSPRWSPDGRSIAFIMKTAEEKSALGSAPRKPVGAQWAEPLTLITDVTYRKDAEGYLTPGFSHVFVVSAQGGAARQLTFGAFDEHGPIAWTPDGRSILLSGNRAEGWQRDARAAQIYQVRVSDAKLTQLTHRAGPATTPRISPDGKKIAYLGFEDRLLGYQGNHVYVMDP